jgi:hypothetical protein
MLLAQEAKIPKLRMSLFTPDGGHVKPLRSPVSQ